MLTLLRLLLAGHFSTSLTAKRIPNGDMLSEPTYQAVRSWLRNCEESHTLCRRIVSSTAHQNGLPARVLDVTPFGDSNQEWLPIGLALARLPNRTFQRVGFAQADVFGNGIEVFQQLEQECLR